MWRKPTICVFVIAQFVFVHYVKIKCKTYKASLGSNTWPLSRGSQVLFLGCPTKFWSYNNFDDLIDLTFITLLPQEEGEGFACLRGKLRETLIGSRNVSKLSHQYYSNLFCLFYSRLNQRTYREIVLHEFWDMENSISIAILMLNSSLIQFE